jgi:hypothetical protein
MQQCPQTDRTNALIIALLISFSWLYQTALFSLLGTRLLDNGEFSPEIVVICGFLATFVATVDIYAFGFSANFLAGWFELKRGGIDLGPINTIQSYVYLGVRLILSIGLAQLTAIAFGLLLFADDITARIDATYREANSIVTRDATALVDAAIARAKDAMTAQSARVEALSTQVHSLRQTELDGPSSVDPSLQDAQHEVTELLGQKTKADDDVQAAENFAAAEHGGIKNLGNSGQPGDGPRWKAAMEEVANAKKHAEDIASALEASRGRLDVLREKIASANEARKQGLHDQLPTFEGAFADEQTKLQALKDEFSQLTEHRNEAIERAVRSAPNFVARSDGMLAQLTALEHIAESDSKIAFVIILIDLTSFGFELAAVICKVTAYIPTSCSALMARDHFMRVVRIVDGMMAELNRAPGNENIEILSPVRPANDNQRNGSGYAATNPFNPDNPARPPKRKRGRPRKNPQANSLQVPESQNAKNGDHTDQR